MIEVRRRLNWEAAAFYMFTIHWMNSITDKRRDTIKGVTSHLWAVVIMTSLKCKNTRHMTASRSVGVHITVVFLMSGHQGCFSAVSMCQIRIVPSKGLSYYRYMDQWLSWCPKIQLK